MGGGLVVKISVEEIIYFTNRETNNMLKLNATETIKEKLQEIRIKYRWQAIDLENEAIEKAKKAYFERRDYTHKISVPKDFYGQNMAYQNNYSSLELMEINAYTQYLISRKIIKELPIPKSLF